MNNSKNLSRILTISMVFVLLMILNYSSSVAAYSLAQIEDPFGPLDKFKSDLNSVGVTYERVQGNISITIDEQKVINALPDLESQGVISKPDLEIFTVAPISISVVIVGVSSTMLILNSLFERNESLEKVNVQAYLIPIGQVTKTLCYSFKYDRKNFMLLDLSLLTPRKFIKTTPDFIFNDWCKQNIDKEAVDLKSIGK